MDIVKQLTGKNCREYEAAASHIIDNADVNAFKKLVEQDDFLFEFIKDNVAKRLEEACNKDNFRSLIKFLKHYSRSYDEFIAKTLAKYADEDITDTMLDLLENGTDDEKTYCAKFFSYIQDPLALELLRHYAYDEFEPLALNCAITLSAMKDRECVNTALKFLKSDDEFTCLSAVKFLSAYQEKNALADMFEVMKKSSMSEYIASEIAYLENFFNLLESEHRNNTLLAINYLLQGLGEIIPLSQIFVYQLYNVFDKLLCSQPDGKSAIVLLNARDKFNQLTENDEYLYDEDKNTKTEVNEIKNLLNCAIPDDLSELVSEELDESSDFIYSALDLAKNAQDIRHLLTAKNQTIILKTLEVLKSMNQLTSEDKSEALNNITDENIKAIVLAL